MSKHIVASIDEIPVGECKIVQAEGRSIGVFNVNGEFYALRNVCPHQGAPVCLGSVGGMTVSGDREQGTLDQFYFINEGEILRCPWHAWEFDIKTGKSIYNPDGYKIKTYDVTVASPTSEKLQVEMYSVTVQSNYVVVHL